MSEQCVPILPLEPRPAGEPPCCRLCGCIAPAPMQRASSAIDPICAGCAGYRIINDPSAYCPTLLDWATGVQWGARLDGGEAVP